MFAAVGAVAAAVAVAGATLILVFVIHWRRHVAPQL